MYPDAGITTDIIVGFPGETDADFGVSLDFAAAMRFSDVHAFPYSPRPGTSAAHFSEQVAEPEKRARMRMGEMLALSAESRCVPGEPVGSGAPGAVGAFALMAGAWSVRPDRQLLQGANIGDFSVLSNRITNARLTGWKTIGCCPR